MQENFILQKWRTFHQSYLNEDDLTAKTEAKKSQFTKAATRFMPATKGTDVNREAVGYAIV